MEGFIENLETLDSRQFLIAIRHLANSLSYGTDKSRFLGSGVEYVQSRPYIAGDPVRSIDWRVTARTRRFYVKEYESPKQLPVIFLIDTSASMMVSSIGRTKYETALHLAGGLALASLDRVSPVGVVGVGEKNIRIDPSLSKNRIMEWLLDLRRFRYDEQTTLARRIREMTPRLPSKVFLVVLSDLHDQQGVPSLKHLAQLHDCVVLQLQDPSEVGLKNTGFFRAQEAETGREFVTHSRRKWFDQNQVSQEMKRSGIDHLLIRTDRPFAHSVRHLFQSRGSVGRGAR